MARAVSRRFWGQRAVPGGRRPGVATVSACACPCAGVREEGGRRAGSGAACPLLPLLPPPPRAGLLAGRGLGGEGAGARRAPHWLSPAAHVAGPSIKAAAAALQPVLLPPRLPRDADSPSAAAAAIAMAIDAFLGKWCLVSSEGFEEYMKELGKGPAALRLREGGKEGGRAGC